VSDVVAGDQVAADWVVCLVLTVAPKPYMAQVAKAVRRAERTIFSAPALVDIGRVATTSTPDPIGGDLDDIALSLYRELVTWAQSPARNPAPRFTFCVLLVHPDAQEAGRLVRNLAATNVLSQLPILFRISGFTPTPRSQEVDVEPKVDENAGLEQMILDAVNVTAQEVDKAPGFCLTANQLAAIVAGRSSRPSPAPILEQQPQAPETESTQPPTMGVPSHSTASPGEAIDTTPPPDDSDRARPAAVEDQTGASTTLPGRSVPPPVTSPGAGVQRRSAGRAMLGRLAGSARSLLTRRSMPASSIEVINDLSQRVDRVSMLYIVLVSEPVRPSRQCRKLRIEVALTLARTLLLGPGSGCEPWYVRAFTADRELHAGIPLPGPDLLRHRDFPERWGEYFDVYDSVGDITESIDRDTSSFVRRGLQPPRTVVVFLAGPAPGGGADSARRLADLCMVAETIWVSFSGNTPVADDFAAVGAHFLRYHEDLVDELLRLIAGGPRSGPNSPPSDDIPVHAMVEPPEAGSPSALPTGTEM
jgi:hypothetical protein